MAPSFNRRKASINNSFRKGQKEELSSEQIKEKTKEFLKRGGNIEKLNATESIMDLEIVANRNDKSRWSEDTPDFKSD